MAAELHLRPEATAASAAAERPMVELERVSKRYGAVAAVRDVQLAVRPGEFLTLLGPSGCGKTTTLRLIAGFENPTTGVIRVDGRDVTHLPPFSRPVNTVFQDYALFPHLDVFENVAFGLRAKRVPEAEIRKRVAEALRLVALEEYAHRSPQALSGGQRQRVAVARAIVNRPKVLLLDEPLSALDLKLRKQMQTELKQLQRRLSTTFIYVTHDQDEALSMSDRIVVMNGGAVEQIGTPQEVYERPASRFVAEFVGETNLIDGVVAAERVGHFAAVDTGGRLFACPSIPEGVPVGTAVHLSIRPEALRLLPPDREPEPGFGVRGVISDRTYAGPVIKVVVDAETGHRFQTLIRTDETLAGLGDRVVVTWPAERVAVLLS